MAANADPLIRFLLPESYTRGAIIRGRHIFDEAARVHGLSGVPAELFGKTLLASVLLLSISKGGMRQVLQLDAHPEQAHAPIRRILAESRPGMVRGYLHWQEEHASMRDESAEGISAWMGHPIRVSTVRDLGFGTPYVSPPSNTIPTTWPIISSIT
jgi:redox-regulated HSP33 family molecular chaperone